MGNRIRAAFLALTVASSMTGCAPTPRLKRLTPGEVSDGACGYRITSSEGANARKAPFIDPETGPVLDWIAPDEIIDGRTLNRIVGEGEPQSNASGDDRWYEFKTESGDKSLYINDTTFVNSCK